MSRSPRIGLRLADYNRIFGVASSHQSKPLLLQSRGKQRYFNPIESELEHLTVLARVLQSENPIAHELLRQRVPELDLDSEREKLKNPQSDSIVLQLMNKHNKSHSDLAAWLQSARSKSLDGALDAMDGQKWPTFLLLYTFNRPVTTRSQAFRLFNIYQEYIGSVEPQYQLELCWLAIDVAQHRLIEYLVPIARYLLKELDPSLDKVVVCNELLWKLAKYATKWSKSDLQVIKAAQQQVVQAFGNACLDKKGYTALAYIAHFESRSLALQIINGAPPPPPDTTDLPYIYGTELIRLNSCESIEQGLATLNSISKENRKPVVWEAFLNGLITGGFLDGDDEMVIKLYRYWKHSEIRPSSKMIGLVIRKVKSFQTRREILDEFLALPNIKLTPSLFASIMEPVTCYEDFIQAKQFLYPLGPQNYLNQRVLEGFLAMQAHWEPQQIWETYEDIKRLGDPTSSCVAYLCQAAAKSSDWKGKDPVQYAVGQVKHWIQQDTNEHLKSYPTEALVHWYIVMLGKANFQFELDNVMTWLHAIQFKPTKPILCALILYSQYGYTMQKLAPKSQEWPTEQEVNEYRQGIW